MKSMRLIEEQYIDSALRMVRAEIRLAGEKFPPMRSPHEGYAIIKEEVDEMWDAIKKNEISHSRGEAIQVAAMAVRYAMDISEWNSNK